jgi:hypothetical protein
MSTQADRGRAYTAWAEANAVNERHSTPRNSEAEQRAWEVYVDVCNDLEQCIEPDCLAYTPAHVYCELHRPR